ncbi:MAG: hypothetical protein ACREEB_18255 [Caulobacteraceae bacterium]
MAKPPPNPAKPGAPKGDAAREKRLAEALRLNLRRRKAARPASKAKERR